MTTDYEKLQEENRRLEQENAALRAWWLNCYLCSPLWNKLWPVILFFSL